MIKIRGGFTLIELMVAIAVMGILVGGGIASYRQFNDKQRVLTAGKDYMQILRVAQKKAKAGDKPAGCNTLYGYRVSADLSQVTVAALCDGGSVVIPDSPSDRTFESDIVFQSAKTYDFLVLAGGVVGAGTVQLGNNNTLFEIDVTSTGSISGGQVE